MAMPPVMPTLWLHAAAVVVDVIYAAVALSEWLGRN